MINKKCVGLGHAALGYTDNAHINSRTITKPLIRIPRCTTGEYIARPQSLVVNSMVATTAVGKRNRDNKVKAKKLGARLRALDSWFACGKLTTSAKRGVGGLAANVAITGSLGGKIFGSGVLEDYLHTVDWGTV